MDLPFPDTSMPSWPGGALHIAPSDLPALDLLAPEALTTGLPARLVGVVDSLLACDLDGHPWCQLLAAAACHDAYRGDPRAVALVDAATASFESAGDTQALGVAANVRANIALGRGDIASAVQWWQRAESLLGRQSKIAITAAAHGSLDAYAKGDLVAAEQKARDALLLADAAGRPGESIVPLVYLTLYAFCLGDFERCIEILRTADEVSRSLTVPRNEGALVVAFSGVLEAVRGREVEADRCFDEALARAEADKVPWYGMMARTLRADHTARWAPHRSLVDARLALQEAEALGDIWWHGLARHAEGVALAELGNLPAAREVLERAIGELANPVERAFAQLELGEVLLGLGDRPAAREVLEQARQAFEWTGARYWATRTSLAMGSADRDRGGRWLRLARSTAVEDPAYDRLFSPSQELKIRVLGTPSVLLDGNRVEFLTRHAELATYVLAIAGARGIPAEELCVLLWPGVDERRAGPRLRTLLWQVRNALGREAWRVQRRRGLVLLDLTGVEVDLHRQAIERQERSAAAGLAAGESVEPDATGHGGPAHGGSVVGGPIVSGSASSGSDPGGSALGGRDRAADAKGSGSGEDESPAAAETSLVLLEGWNVTLPPSLTLP